MSVITPQARPTLLMVAKSDTRFHRGIIHGTLAYAHQHTNWRITCHTAIAPARQERLQPAGILSLEGEILSAPTIDGRTIPFVQVGNPQRGLSVSSVCTDESVLGTMAADYLWGLGLRHFAFVAHGNWPFVRERLDGFARAVAALGGEVRHFIGYLYDRRREARFHRNLATMLRQLPRPCGLLAANDALGVEIVSACRALQLRVPEDIAVLGVDDDELACELSEVPLSSVAQPLFALGYEAARMLHQQMQRPDCPRQELYLPPVRIVARASSDLIALDDVDVAGALRLINANFAEPINVNWLVRHLPIARRSLERRFKTLVGRTILEQIHHLRFRKAKELLADSDLGLNVVAQRSGFVNARWLADCFRRELGTTPARFRQQFRAESGDRHRQDGSL